jgi:hypothetical protein
LRPRPGPPEPNAAELVVVTGSDDESIGDLRSILCLYSFYDGSVASFRARGPLAREALLCAGSAAVLAAALAWLGPPGSDMAAHAYQRALFLEHGFTLWNNFWYAGRYSFVTYSVLYYPLAALLGIRLLAVATVTTAALAFAVVTGREWGPTARWSSRSFAIVWTGIVLSAAFPFALGVALALLALWALQERAQGLFVALALLTLAASPLSFALLTVIAAGVALAKRIELRRTVVPAGALAAMGGIELVLWRIFPDNGRYPFSGTDLAAASAFSVLGAMLVWRIERARILRMILLFYGLACVAAYLVPSALGSNITRLQFIAIPIAVLAASLRSWRPLPVCLLAIALAVSWNVKPLVRSVSQGAENDAAAQKYWQPAIRFLHMNLTPAYRVEAVDTVGHWPAEYLAASGIPLARGWFRQDDFPGNAILYGHLTRARYTAWLHGLGVSYVVLSSAQPDYSASDEARLLRSGTSGLRVALRMPHLTIFAVPNPSGILSGGLAARLVSLSQTRLVLWIAHPGRYRLAVRYSPYWRISSGCVVSRRDGMSDVLASRRGLIALSFDVDAEQALATFAGRSGRTCSRVDGRRSSEPQSDTHTSAPARARMD